jgi:Highly conserved protein containing a thioredoxin domain
MACSVIADDYGNKVNFFDGTYEEALLLAAKENKGIMIDFNTEWCIWCRNLEMRVFTNEEFADFVNANLINLKIDAEKGDGIRLAEEFEARGFPTTIYLNSEGKELGRVAGYMPPKEFLDYAKQIIVDGLTMEYLKTEVDKGSNDPKVLYYYAERLYSDGNNEEAIQFYKKVSETDSDYREDAEMMLAIINEDNQKMKELAEMYPDNALTRDIALTFLNESFESKDDAEIQSVIKNIEAIYPDDEFVKFYIGQYYLGKASKVMRDSNATNEERLSVMEFTNKAEPYLQGMIFVAGVDYVRSELEYQMGNFEKANEYINKSLSLWSYRKLYKEQKNKIVKALGE